MARGGKPLTADSMTEEYLFYDPVTFMNQIGPDRPQSLSSSSPELLALRFAG